MAVVIYGMLLMPLSQVVAWILIWRAQSTDLYPAVTHIAFFYFLWAVFNFYFLGVPDLGMFSMGFLTCASFFRKRIVSMMGSVLVLFNFGLASYIAFSQSATALALAAKEGTGSLELAWAWMFRIYVLSNLALWSFCLYKQHKLPPSTEYAAIPR